jgi:hypothetical protein
MRRLSNRQLLDIWERECGQPAPLRALGFVAAALDCTLDEVMALPLGRRDYFLSSLQERLFGPELESVATCPQCQTELETRVTASEIWQEQSSVKEWTLEVAGYRIALRAPDTAAVLDMSQCDSVAEARQLLLDSCVSATTEAGEGIPARVLPQPVVNAIDEALEAGDPQANIQLAISCQECGHSWREVLDIQSFLWSEIHAWAQRLLREVHAIAVAYGWSEAEILLLSEWRRQFYLGMIGA